MKGNKVFSALQEYYAVANDDSVGELPGQGISYVFIDSNDDSDYGKMHAESILIESLMGIFELPRNAFMSLSVTKPPCAKCEEYIRKEFTEKEKLPDFVKQVYSGVRHDKSHTQFGANDNYNINDANWKVADRNLIKTEWIDRKKTLARAKIMGG